MPGRPQTVAVSLRNAGSTPSNLGLVIYDDGVARGMAPVQLGSTTFGWTRDATAIFGLSFGSFANRLRRVNVGPEGATEAWVNAGLLESSFLRLQVVGDQIYGGDGRVVDGDLRERLGNCGVGGLHAVDRALGRAFFWGLTTIFACELATYQLLGYIPAVVEAPSSGRGNLVRWGTDGLAFTDGQKIYLVRTPLAAP